MMRPVSRAMLCAVLLLGASLPAAPPAAAQYGGMGGMGGMRGPMGGGNSTGQSRALAPPPPQLKPDNSLRLDAGALFCRSLEDLRRRVALQANPSLAGAGPRPNCRTMAGAVPITVLERAGLGATQVQIGTPQAETGWTDAWLPDRGGMAQASPGGRRAP